MPIELSPEQERELKEIYHEKEGWHDKFTYIELKNIVKRFYENAFEYGYTDPWTYILDALEDAGEDLTKEALIKYLEDTLHVPYETPEQRALAEKEREIEEFLSRRGKMVIKKEEYQRLTEQIKKQKEALEREQLRKFIEAEKEKPPIEKRLDEILERLEKLEKRIAGIPPAAPPTPPPAPPPARAPSYRDERFAREKSKLDREWDKVATSIRTNLDVLLRLGILTEDEAREYYEEISDKRKTALFRDLDEGKIDLEDVRREIDILKEKLEALKALRERRKEIKERAITIAGVGGITAPPPLGYLGRGIGENYAALMFRPYVIVRKGEYHVYDKAEIADRMADEMKVYLDRYTGPIEKKVVKETGEVVIYHGYIFEVPWLDQNTLNSLMAFIANKKAYFDSGAYLYGPFYTYADTAFPPLDENYVWYEDVLPEELKPWYDNVCKRVIPKIRDLGYEAIGQSFSVYE